jgi:hypothetical protein
MSPDTCERIGRAADLPATRAVLSPAGARAALSARPRVVAAAVLPPAETDPVHAWRRDALLARRPTTRH